MATNQKIGIQLYTLGEEVAADFEGTLRQVADIGYGEVELPHFYQMEPERLARSIADAGLTCPSLHVPLATAWPGMPTLQDAELILKGAAALGVSNIVVPIFPFPDRLAQTVGQGKRGPEMISDIAQRMTISDWQKIAEELNEKAAMLAPHGLKLSYHNHNPEFVKLPDGRTAFDVLLDETDPLLVGIELDVGWVAAAGLDPVAMVERNASRIDQVHLRDLTPTEPNTAIRMNPADLGQGVMDWKNLLPALRRAGCQHFYLEQEAPFPGSRMDSARVGFNFLQSALAN